MNIVCLLLSFKDYVTPSHVANDSCILCVPAYDKEVSSCAVLYGVDAGEFLSSPYDGAVADNRSYYCIVELVEDIKRHPSERVVFRDD